MRRGAIVVAVTAAVLLGACSSGGSGAKGASSTARASSTTASPTAGALGGLHLATAPVVTLAAPTALAARAGTTDLFVAEKAGTVRRVTVDRRIAGSPVYRVVDSPVLDLSSKVADSGEQGLLGLAFSSDGRQLFVFATLAPDGTTSVAEYDMRNNDTADPNSRRELLSIPRTHANHNGGQLAFGPDGFLYIGIGDGGSEGDPDHHGQDTSTLFGKILRIDPAGGTGKGSGAGKAYGIPPGNPFADAGGKPEIWLSGVRNPWRFSFDSANGDLWIGDVGQDKWEEVDRLPATAGRDAGQGANLGWSLMEGTHPYAGTNPPGGVLPIYEYSHDQGCSITGGFVYRGKAIPALQGAYLFADYCGHGIRAIVADTDTGAVVGSRSFDLPVAQVQSFGEDATGEIYVLPASGPIVRLVSAA
ncbi:MAG: sugar dehydrogenase [Acidimicrobiales bacterium]|nr:sugar dehydrogenase [Acidimicrobiales bacterium]